MSIKTVARSRPITPVIIRAVVYTLYSGFWMNAFDLVVDTQSQNLQFGSSFQCSSNAKSLLTAFEQEKLSRSIYVTDRGNRKSIVGNFV